MFSRPMRLPTARSERFIILLVGIATLTSLSARKVGTALLPTTVMNFDVNNTVNRNYTLRILDPVLGSSVNAFSVDFKGCRPRKERTVVCVPLLGDETVSDILWMKVWATMSLFSVSSDGWWMHLDFDAFPKLAAAQIKLRTSQITAQRDPVYDVNSGVYFAFVSGGGNSIIEEWAEYRQSIQVFSGQAHNLAEQDSLNKLREVGIRKVRTVPDGHLAYHSYGGDGKSKERLVEFVSDWRTSSLAMPEFIIGFVWIVTMARLAPGIRLLVFGRIKVSSKWFSREEVLYLLHMVVLWYLCMIAVIRSSFYALGSSTFEYRDSFFDLGVADFYDAHRRYFIDERGACTIAWNAAMSCVHLTHPLNLIIHQLTLHMVAADSSDKSEIFRRNLVYNVLFLFIARALLVPVWEPRYRQQVLFAHESKQKEARWNGRCEDVHLIYNKEAGGHFNAKVKGRLAMWPFHWNKKDVRVE